MRNSDEELMIDYCNGNEKAFDQLYSRYEKPLLNFIYRMTMNATDLPPIIVPPPGLES